MDSGTLPCYSGAMPAELLNPNVLSDLPRSGLFLLYSRQAPNDFLLTLAVHLARTGQPLRVFDGCNGFDGYFVARLAYRLDPQPAPLLARITLSRAFTCFQLAQRIQTAPRTAEPLIILGLLDTFYDESVPLPEAERLLAESLQSLRLLAEHAPVIVGTSEPRGLDAGRWVLLNRLQAAVDRVYAPAVPQELPGMQQLVLF